MKSCYLVLHGPTPALPGSDRSNALSELAGVPDPLRARLQRRSH